MTDREDGESLLAAMQFADSFLPAGSFTTSYGLEAFVAASDIENGAGLRELLETYVQQQLGPCEMVSLSAAHDGADTGEIDRLVAVDERLTAVQLPSEFRTSATKTGSQLLSLVTETEPHEVVSEYDRRVTAGEAPGNYAVVLGVVGACTGMSPRETAITLGYAFVRDLLGAAQRVLRLGHTEVQQVLTDLRPKLVEAWERNRDRSVTEMTTFAPLVDVASMEHERADRRLFVS
ncbi:urease accessory protein UreF [Halorientalis salina]|uniref:urease accessory protein UreF n=1 Tax=Halorientalis salina TaxID=2932266 RepID=UPI0010ABE437|nr:urease accessory UreF family protein [Halorientalis salina]